MDLGVISISSCNVAEGNWIAAEKKIVHSFGFALGLKVCMNREVRLVPKNY